MSLRSLSKGRFLISILIFIFFLWIAYLYLNSLQLDYNSTESGNRCMSELSSIKYQLNVVTEYKNRIDRLLTETQKAREADKERYKDILESCGAMKQHIAICQSQFEDLLSECKRVKEDYDKLRKDTEKVKTS
ncbi:PREDICTED: uncharacterized protein LOC106126193 [Papilio xuthus]|uniref:Uncharacterized protein LOC106126193 n=1 Tax=Papilio xuthus TaxID=66420 RepID=A0A194PLB7_PAPXU|nr:PREDICTED: uncharacterized protein LOC106126193 [Papilio xuthus]KPI91900.1 hypothetical protein RR46_08326 [Papilio xuthus]